MEDPGVLVRGPLAPWAAAFAQDLSQRGYRRSTVRSLMRRMACVSSWLVSKGLGAADLGPEEVERFIAGERAGGRHPSRLRALLSYLRAQAVVPTLPAPVPQGPVEEVLERFRRYLTIERALGSHAVYTYVKCVRLFLCNRLEVQGSALRLEDLCAGDITAFMVGHCPHQSRGVAKHTVTALRSFLRFLHVVGVIPRPLVSAVPAVAGWRQAWLPKGLEPREVRRLLESCDRRTRVGRRDFAILTILVRLGLRACEVAALGLDDIDWRRGEFVVRGKGNRQERLPLPADVGEALAAYLRKGRDACEQCRAVFLRHRAPRRALSRIGIGMVVMAAARRARLRGIHVHRLRHTTATLMLRAGASLPEIGQVLRHCSAGVTAIYAKVHRKALRSIARPWPGGAQ